MSAGTEAVKDSATPQVFYLHSIISLMVTPLSLKTLLVTGCVRHLRSFLFLFVNSFSVQVKIVPNCRVVGGKLRVFGCHLLFSDHSVAVEIDFFFPFPIIAGVVLLWLLVCHFGSILLPLGGLKVE